MTKVLRLAISGLLATALLTTIVASGSASASQFPRFKWDDVVCNYGSVISNRENVGNAITCGSLNTGQTLRLWEFSNHTAFALAHNAVYKLQQGPEIDTFAHTTWEVDPGKGYNGRPYLACYDYQFSLVCLNDAGHGFVFEASDKTVVW